jgi:SanA protein
MIRAITNFFRITFRLLELGVLLLILGNVWVVALTSGRTYNKISKVPPRDCALVLGTSPKMRSGVANPYFTARMDAVGTLYHHGKIKKIIVSGEKSENYDEPEAMKHFLVYNEGVPEDIIIKDPKGFNTHKSILRCKNVYGQKNVIIVSQGFHNLRALFFARNNGMNALGYDAQDVSKNESFYRNHTREFFARVLAVFYYILGISPEE